MSQQPAYYAVIPADVRYCKTVEPCARLLYGEITALTSKEGFCWASNEYFAELYQVDTRTITRWLQSLNEHNFIQIDTVKVGMKWDRKIWIKEISTTRQKLPDRVDNKVQIDETKTATDYYKEQSTTKEQQTTRAREPNKEVVPAAPVVVFSCLENLGLPEESKISITKAFANDQESVIIAVEMSKDCKTKIDNLGGYIRSVAKTKPKRKPGKKDEVDNRKLAESLSVGLESKYYKIEFLHTYVEFTPIGMGQPKVLQYDENGFESKFDKLRRELRFVKQT